MEIRINKNKSITYECNVLTHILNPTKHEKSKYDHYLPILLGCMNTHSGREEFRNFRIILDSGISSTIVIGKLMSKIKQKKIRKSYLGKPSKEIPDLKEDELRFQPTII